VFDMGAVGIWASLFIALTAAAILLTARFLDKSKRVLQEQKGNVQVVINQH
jgi:Na+-driven multidrug efflux pump